MSDYKGVMLNEHWSEDSIVNCCDKLCYTEEWGYFVFGGAELKIVSDSVLYEKKEDKYALFNKNARAFTSRQAARTMDDIDAFLGIQLYSGTRMLRRDLKSGTDFAELISNFNSYVLTDVAKHSPERYEVKFAFCDCKFGPIKPEGQDIAYLDIGGYRVNAYSRMFAFDDLQKAREFLSRKILVCNINDVAWYNLSVLNIFNHKIGDRLYCAATGEAEITEIYNQPAAFKVRVRLPSGEESDHEDFSRLFELPTYIDTEFDELNRAFKEQFLSPYAVREGNILNVHWFKVADAATYHVALYRLVYRAGLPCVMKMEDFNVDRNTLFLSVGGLVGRDFLIKVYAEGRDGETVSESRCIQGSGEPVSIKRKQ